MNKAIGNGKLLNNSYLRTVKWFCKSFVLYFLALVLMPCADIHAYVVSGMNPALITQEHNDCPHEKESDFCSPFCICNCCGQVVMISTKQRINIPSPGFQNSDDSIGIMAEAYWQNKYLDRLFHPPRV